MGLSAHGAVGVHTDGSEHGEIAAQREIGYEFTFAANSLHPSARRAETGERHVHEIVAGAGVESQAKAASGVGNGTLHQPIGATRDVYCRPDHGARRVIDDAPAHDIGGLGTKPGGCGCEQRDTRQRGCEPAAGG